MTDLILPGVIIMLIIHHITIFVTDNLVLKEKRVDDYGSECTSESVVIIIYECAKSKKGSIVQKRLQICCSLY